MRIEFDPAKSARNEKLRGISFEALAIFEWATAVVIADTRRDYGEPRYRALGFAEGRLHSLVFTPRADGIRVISLRRANCREVRRYETQDRPGTD
jgi:uncharacterized protein